MKSKELPHPNYAPNHKEKVLKERILRGFDVEVNDSKISPDGRFMACSGDKGHIWLVPIHYSMAPDENDINAFDFDSAMRYRHFQKPNKICLGRYYYYYYYYFGGLIN